MLLKFGKMGKEVREYCVQDEMTVEEFLSDVVSIELGYDDVVHCSEYPEQEINRDNVDEYNVEENATYILETIELTSRESALLDLLEEENIDDMDSKEKKDYLQKIVKHVLSNQWDN